MKPSFSRLCCYGTGLLSLALAASAWATPTENNDLSVLPTPGKVTVDGKIADWDLSGSLYATGDAERFRDVYGVWIAAMYDKDNLYILARWKDPTPLDNDQSSKGGYGFRGDCLQVRFITAYKGAEERVSHWTCWRDRDGISVMDVAYGRKINEDKIPNAIDQGAQQTFQVDADGKGYIQELAIPWKLLTQDKNALAPTSKFRITVEPNFTAGPGGRVTIKDIFRSGIAPDRIFTFRAYDAWGEGTLETKGKLPLRPVRMDDAREFPTKLENGVPVVDWTGLIQERKKPGFKSIAFDMPFDGYVSLNLKDAKGKVVRQLLTAEPYMKGRQEVKWDGLTTPFYKTPGQVVDAGDYIWEAIAHPGFKLTYRGTAHNSGSIPWENGPTSSWGADHGVADAVATDGDRVYLGWGYAEAGRSVYATDLDGNVKWRIGVGTGTSCEHLAVDGGSVYSLGIDGGLSGAIVTRLRAKDGVYENWEGTTSAGLYVNSLWAGRPDAAEMPQNANGMDVKNGTMYLAFGNQAFIPSDITDWKTVVARLGKDDVITDKITSKLDRRFTDRLNKLANGKMTQEIAFAITPDKGPFYQDQVLEGLNRSLRGDLVGGYDDVRSDQHAFVNRKALETEFAGAMKPARPGFIALVDAKTGKLKKTVNVPSPYAVHAVSDELIYVISGGTTVLAVNPATGASKPVITGLERAQSLSTGPDGRIYVGVGGADQQVKVFSADGKLVETIGRKGGRAILGPWQKDGIYAANSIDVDAKGNLWVAEGDFTPKRVSVWNTAGGAFVKEYFGGTHYGASGGAIDPRDPNIMVGEGCEWKLDPATGKAECTGTIENNFHSFAQFHHAPNGKTYLVTIVDYAHYFGMLRVYEKLGEGDYRLRSEIKPDYVNPNTTVWYDLNGDGQRQGGETTSLPYTIGVAGSNLWSSNVNPADLTIFAGCPDKNTVLRIKLAGYAPSGAPKWDFDNAEELPYVWNPKITRRGLGSLNLLASPDNSFLVTCEPTEFNGYDLKTNTKVWSYPNTFAQVHGSHRAPPSEPGLMRGAYGLVGTFKTPQTGNVWTVNANLGEWYMLTEKGYFLSTIFEGDTMKQKFPDKAVPGGDMTNAPSGGGGEDFGGSVTQAPDGRVYIEAGKTAVWNLEATGFENIKTIGNGTVTLKPEELPLAQKEREAQMQAAAGTLATIVKKASPEFTGNLSDFRGVQTINYQKTEDAAVRTAATWDENALYLGWEVKDATPWMNGAAAPSQMYLGGDTVDFQMGTQTTARRQAVAGDLRISIGDFGGVPTAVLYRPVSDVKKPMTFNSGVIAKYVVDYVDVAPEIKAQVKIRPDRRGYTVEAAIPWSLLGVQPKAGLKLRGDFGATHANSGNTRTKLRTYWNNQETGLTDDAVFELQLSPNNWGEIQLGE